MGKRGKTEAQSGARRSYRRGYEAHTFCGWGREIRLGACAGRSERAARNEITVVFFWDSALGREPLSPRYSGLSLVARLLLGLSFRAWAIAHRSAGFLILWRAVVGGEAEPWMREGVLGGHARLGVSSTGAA